MSRPVLQFTRLTNSSRLPDRFLACQVRELTDGADDSQARLFVVIEIIRPWLQASQIGQALLQAFLAGYQDAPSTDGLKQVEAGLKRVNETLVHLTQQGETEWVGHLHALFAVENHGVVHVAQTGRAAALLVREGTVSRITELEGAQSAATASRTFGTVTSGDLAPGDALVIGSGELTRAIGTDALAESLQDATAAEGMQRFARILRQHQTRAAAAIIIRAYDARVLADQPLLSEPDVIYLDEAPIETIGGSLRSIGIKAARWLKLGRQQLQRTGRSVATSVRTHVAPRGQAALESSRSAAAAAWTELRTKHLPNAVAAAKPWLERAHRATKHTTQTTVSRIRDYAAAASAPAPIPSPERPSIQPTHVQGEQLDRGLIGQTLYTIRHYTEASANPRGKLSMPRLRLPRLVWPPRQMWLTELFKPKQRPRLYALLAGILFIILIVNLSLLQHHRQQAQQSAAATASVTALRSRYDDVKLTITLKHDASVAGQLQQILTDLAPFVHQPATATVAGALQHDVEDTLDGLTNTTRVRDAKLTATFTHASGLARLGSDLVTAQTGSNKLLASPIAGQLIDDRSVLGTGETTTALAQLDQTNALVVLSSASTLYQLKNPGDSMSPVSLASGSWEPAVAIASFGNNLYFLDPSANQIWKHLASSDDRYESGSKFITDGTSVSNGISLAIDGSIYVLARDGSITKLTHGQKDSFTVKDLPNGVTITNARAIWTNADSSSLFVLTNTAIIQLSKTGSYTRRYVADQFTNLAAFVIDQSAKQAWVLNGDQAYQLNLAGA